MARKKIYDKLELEWNAIILYPDGRWRTTRGRNSKPPLDEPTYKYNGEYYIKYKARPVKEKKKKKKKAKRPTKAEMAKLKLENKDLKEALAREKVKPWERSPAEISERIADRLFRPLTLIQLLGQRNNIHDSIAVAEAIQEAEAKGLENRMTLAQDEMTNIGLGADWKLNASPDCTINAEFVLYVKGGISIRDHLDLLAKHLKIPPAIWGSVGFRYKELGESIRDNYITVSRRTGDTVLSSEKDRMGALQLQSSYIRSDRGARNIWKFAEKFLGKIYAHDEGKNRPVEIFIRFHWNPYVDDNGVPYAPTRQE